jgi:hypothetical protein
MDRRVNDIVMRAQQPDTLTLADLDLEHEPVTKTPKPDPVRAWVRYGKTPILVDAIAVAWIQRAVAIKWDTPDGEHHAWVWGSAVQSTTGRPTPS